MQAHGVRQQALGAAASSMQQHVRVARPMMRSAGGIRRGLLSKPAPCLPLRSRRCVVSVKAIAAGAPSEPKGFQNPFTFTREMDGLQGALANIPGSLTYVVALLLVGAGAAAGYAAGARTPANVRTIGQVAGALAGAAGAAYASLKLKEKREEAAAVELYNTIVAKGDPRTLTRGDVEAIEVRFGVQLGATQPDALKPIYGAFVEAIIPPGDEPLTGNEAQEIVAFKDALGLDDTDAAGVHIDVGRRFTRARFETSGRGAGVEERRQFQKLIYVSTGVFGEQKAAFLLPWKRVFSLNDAQLYVAKRDNARQLFESHLQAQGELQATKSFLQGLLDYQASIRLADDVAQEVVAGALKDRLDGSIARAIECTQQRTRVKDYAPALAELQSLIDLNRALANLSPDPDLAGLGLRKQSAAGGKYEEASTRANLKELFRIFLDDRIEAEGRFSDALEADALLLRDTLGLSAKEGDAAREDVVSRLYRRLLREEVQSGRLEGADSQAAVLQALCERLHYNPAQAAALHGGLYRQKLEALLEKKKLTDEDSAELGRLRKLLCIPAADVDALHAELCGRIYRAAVEEAVSTGVEGFDTDEKNKVRTVQADVRLEDGAALDIVSGVARKAFMGFIVRARSLQNRLDAAKELKKLVFFSNIVVSPLVEELAVADKDQEAAMKEFAELMAKAKAEAAKEEAEEAEAAAAAQGEAGAPVVEAEVVGEGDEAAAAAAAAEGEAPPAEAPAAAEGAEDGAEGEGSGAKPASLAKAEAAAEARKGGEKLGEVVMKSQKAVTLGDELELRERTDIYRNFLLYCMSGDVVSLPMGSQVVVERDEGEFARLSQLGDILGLSQLDVAGVHQGLAEQAFRSQAQALVGDGNLTKEKAEALTKMREQMGLPKDAADKIIKGVQNQRLIGTLQTAKAQGALTLERLMELKEQGIEVENFVGEELRLKLYTDELTKALSSGSGDVDEERLKVGLPADLVLDAQKVARVTEEVAKDKKRTILVQAVSGLRQRAPAAAVASLNNLTVAYALLPGPPEAWSEKTELQDLYSLYCAKEASEAKRGAVAAALGLSEAEAAGLAEMVAGGGYKAESEVEEEAIF